MEEFRLTRGKRKREEVEISQQTSRDLLKTKSPERKRQKRKTKQLRKRTPRQQKANKPETFESFYTVGEKLGEGGFGSVFAGTRISDGLQVAIKFVPKQEDDRYTKSPYDSRSIPLEVALLQRMSETSVDSVIQLIQWFDEPKRYILILEHPQPCKDLHNLQKKYVGSFSEQMARDLMLQVVRTAIECQKRGIIHRDIKLDNILINMETLQIKLIDFGCGDLIKRFGYDYYEGTFEYCPPEYFLKGRYCAIPATVWSLGVLMFEMVCGFLPFKEEADIIGYHRRCDLHFKDGLSDEFCDLVKWCLHPKPTSRPTLQQILEHRWFKSSSPAQGQTTEKVGVQDHQHTGHQ
ncbi:serine/threonine-protein kinase pim-2-like [Astyanax mexicanus]|uniref:non-specific serine/threonine protein kinase n=1 Tax=Astyanax mexicanus TaxID=7994 RepID=A0A8T2LFZ2_ASTMX|nr:serine/threonine-protein kinase pim-2-like [Astyanax mexicanus]